MEAQVPAPARMCRADRLSFPLVLLKVADRLAGFLEEQVIVGRSGIITSADRPASDEGFEVDALVESAGASSSSSGLQEHS